MSRGLGDRLSRSALAAGIAMTARRDELLTSGGPIGVRRHGTVRWFADEKGYGRITADDGEILFVHFAHIELAGYRTLDAGQAPTVVGRRVATLYDPRDYLPSARAQRRRSSDKMTRAAG